jgi:hypothetical protein
MGESSAQSSCSLAVGLGLSTRAFGFAPIYARKPKHVFIFFSFSVSLFLFNGLSFIVAVACLLCMWICRSDPFVPGNTLRADLKSVSK